MNEGMRRQLPPAPLETASWEDVPESLRKIIEHGWVIDETGAYLLQMMAHGYHGSRSSFADLTGYESSVNGLGIPDWDIPLSGDTNGQLLRRSVSYAYFALRAARQIEGSNALHAIVSTSEALLGESRLTAHVTFVLNRTSELALVDDVEFRQNECLLTFSMEDVNS